MKTKYFALLIAAMGSSLSLGASISNLESAYSKNSTVYDGTNGDTLDVSTPTTLNVNANGSWTMAFTVSNLTATSDSNVGLLFTYNTTKPYYNLEGMGYQLAEDGTLTLNVGGYYVWLGDMLIGEALSVTSGSGCNGLTIQYNGSGTAVLHDLALDGHGFLCPCHFRNA